jgi:hypothetical protein
MLRRFLKILKEPIFTGVNRLQDAYYLFFDIRRIVIYSTELYDFNNSIKIFKIK